MKKYILLLFLLFLSSCSLKEKSWQYMEQPLPGLSPQLFAPDIINHHAHSIPVFTPDGKEIYWSVTSEAGETRKIMYVEHNGSFWSKPQTASFSGSYLDDQPFISRNGEYLYFASKSPPIVNDTVNTGLAIWCVKRTGKSWTRPELVDSRHGFWTPSQTKDGTLYFLGRVGDKVGICRSKRINGEYLEAEYLPEPVNMEGYRNVCPFIAPDESFLLFASNRPGSKDEYGDIFISFRDKHGNWGEAIYLGDSVNTSKQERFPGISPDGKYFFFTRWHSAPHHHDLHWMDAEFISKLK